jgi:DNA/RNA-binding domain of Phe-tRNA-synthetase-like protein
LEGIPEDWEAAPEPGWVAPVLNEEFPGLAIHSTTVGCGSGRSPKVVKEQLHDLSDRFGGAQAMHLRERPIPWAYRVFFRQIGLDPDVTRTPIEELSFQRMFDGGFKSKNRLDDALTIATMEAGVALYAFDADRLEGRLGIRPAVPGEKFEGLVGSLADGTLVIADEQRPVALLFGDTAEGREVHPKTERTLLAAIGVKGVPDIALEEALWLAAVAMRA